MARRARRSSLKAPFLKQISLLPERAERGGFPFGHLSFLKDDDFSLGFEAPITVFVGENGTGKSTLLEAIAQHCGFSPIGGSQEHALAGRGGDAGPLARALRFSCLPKVTRGFFFRSESFYNVASYLDEVGSSDRHGGRRLHEQSHGESFLAVFQHRFESGRHAMFLLDEPETALSPVRQLAFLSLLRDWEASGNVQVIMATHAPILMSYPGAVLISFDGGTLEPVALEETEHYRVTKTFLGNPERYLAEIFADDD
jgi:predicted ATPase